MIKGPETSIFPEQQRTSNFTEDELRKFGDDVMNAGVDVGLRLLTTEEAAQTAPIPTQAVPGELLETQDDIRMAAKYRARQAQEQAEVASDISTNTGMNRRWERAEEARRRDEAA